MRSFILILLGIILSACSSIIPATTPPQLAYTPGAAITISDETIYTDIFQVNYPDAWRVVKINVATDPIELVFASQDGGMWIKISENPIAIPEGTPDPTLYEHLDMIEIDGINIYIQGQSPIEKRDLFDEIYQHVLDSIEIS